MVVEFKNEPGYDFSVQENVDMFKKALKDVEKELGQDIPLVERRFSKMTKLNQSILQTHHK